MYGNSHYFCNSGLTLNLTLLCEQKLEQWTMLHVIKPLIWLDTNDWIIEIEYQDTETVIV